MRIPKEPNKPTCSQINEMVSTLTNISIDMEYCVNLEDIEKIQDAISGWIYDIKNIGVGRYSELEDLRKSNSELRDWGSTLVGLLEEVTNEKDSVESDLNDIITRLENQSIND